MSASFIEPSPIARRAEKPVPTPKSIRPGAMAFSVAKAEAEFHERSPSAILHEGIAQAGGVNRRRGRMMHGRAAGYANGR
ncbi:MAG TPA: hypothetical protein VGC09_20250 [Rhodopila sp.]